MSKRRHDDDVDHGKGQRFSFFKSKADQDESDAPKLYSIFQGEVVSVKDYGAFVKIPGYNRQGLVHKSQLSQSRVENPAEVVDNNEKVWCKVISLEDNKIGLSMKVVNQGSGADLDPSLVQNSQDAQRRKQGFKREIPKIELGAVYDTVCRKCGCKGHFAQDCFVAAGGKKYELVTEEDLINETNEDSSKTEKKHKKKKKHKHKLCSTNEREGEPHREHKKHKKHHKH